MSTIRSNRFVTSTSSLSLYSPLGVGAVLWHIGKISCNSSSNWINVCCSKLVAKSSQLTVTSKWTAPLYFTYGTGAQNTINFFKANKGVWWMPRVYEAKKDVVSCDKLRGAAHERYIRRFPNGTTCYTEGVSLSNESQRGELKHLSTRRKRK